MVQPVLPFPGPLPPARAPAAEKKPLTAAQESDIFLLSKDKYITFNGGVFHEKESPVLGGAGVRGLYAPVHWGQPAV